MKRVLAAILVLFVAASTVWAAQDILLDTVDLGGSEDHVLYGWGRSATDETGGSYGGIGDYGCRLVWDGVDDNEWAEVEVLPLKGSMKSLRIRHLDGIADDGFILTVLAANNRWVEVGSYTDQYTDETWVESQFDLSPYGFGRGRAPIAIKIEATGDKWESWGTYGQLCIDWIEVYGNGKPR